MKPIIESLTYPGISSFKSGEYKELNFEYPFHVHSEYEFTCFLKGSGKQIIGDDIKKYNDGELIFLGPNLPHSWRVDVNSKKNPEEHHILNIQFKKDFLGEHFFKKPEMSKVNELLEKSKYGISIFGDTRKLITKQMKKIVREKNLDRIITLLDILNILSISKEYRICSSLGYVPVNTSKTELDRITVVHQYVLENYLNAIKLSEVASKCNMTNSAFCHYFKKRTGKSFIRFVTEMRIKHACKLLKETNENITNICFESGFNNLSHFNRNFKGIIQSTPFEYRKIFENRD